MSSNTLVSRNPKKAWVVSALMGLGHLRAAYPLKDLAYKNIIIDGSPDFCSPHEYKAWKRFRRIYYFMSRSKKIPVIGWIIFAFMRFIQEIPARYPRRDLSTPNLGVRYLYSLIEKKLLSSTLIQKVKHTDLPVVHTFYAAAMALDADPQVKNKNYLMICDTDLSRVWVPADPTKSRILYFAPCNQARRRLMSYGVPHRDIYVTGFPLPKENIGHPERMEVLKRDLFQRLLRMDPQRYFFRLHQPALEHYLGPLNIPPQQDGFFTLTFAIGGSGVQQDMAHAILRTFRRPLADGEMQIYLSAGIDRQIYLDLEKYIKGLGLEGLRDQRVHILYDRDVFTYFQKFNEAMRVTDILWTKPSELTFYSALGIPILIAPPVGVHEEYNARWLESIHAGISASGPVDHAREWLFDLIKSGVLADIAWNGFLKVRKLGTYKIEEIIHDGAFNPEATGMET